MAVVTITTNTYLDGGTARVAGDTYTINGATLTVRTDTRVHANAPAAMTGSLSTMTVSSVYGGALAVDASRVRWMAFDSGTGNVPAIGTQVTQGGVSGYLLGVWPNYQSAPTAAGAAMPATGFLKFREVTGGAYSAGALAGIGASASSPDVVGWIEVCLDAGAAVTGQALGGGIVFSGDWFYLAPTNGTRGQVIDSPTNGGGANTYNYAVQIETAPGSNVFEWFTCAHASLGAGSWGINSYMPDIRSKFVQTLGNGQIRIGSDGTNNVAYLPPAGCRVRMPNIMGRTVATASRAVNQTPGAVTRAALAGGNYTVEGLHSEWTVAAATVQKLSLKKVAMESFLAITINRDPIVLEDVSIGSFTAAATSPLTLTDISAGSVTNLRLVFQPYLFGGIYCPGPVNNMTFTNVEVVCMTVRNPGAQYAMYNQSGFNNVTFNGLRLRNCGGMNIASSSNLTIKNVDYIDRINGDTVSTGTAFDVLNLAGSTNTVFDGLTFGNGGQLSNTQPFGNLYISGTVPNNYTKVRNFGTRLAPLSAGSVAAAYPNAIASIGAAESNLSLQRLYVTATRTAPLVNGFRDISTNLLVEDVYSGTFNVQNSIRGRSSVFRKLGMSPSQITTTAAGTHWIDYFTSETTGGIRWLASAPTSETAALNTLDVVPIQGTGYGIVSNGTMISLDTVNDAAYSECAWPFLGHTSFQNVPPTVTVVQVGAPVYTPTATIVAGMQYTILTTGTTDFTTYGAPNSNPGTVFTATANGTIGGTGTLSRLVAGQTYTIYTPGGTNWTAIGAPNNLAGTTFTAANITAANITAASTGTVTNVSMVYYQLDTGSGYSGAWKLATGVNLSSEVLPASGFRMKMMIRQNLAAGGTSADFASVTFYTNTTAAAQAAAMYPLDTVSLTLEGLKPGSEVRAYVGTDPATAVQIGGTESSGDTFTFTHSASGQDGYIHIFAIGYQPIMIPRTYSFSDTSLLIQQVIDRNYYNP